MERTAQKNAGKEEIKLQQAILNDLRKLNEKYQEDVSAHYHFTLQPINLYFKNNPSKRLQKDIISVFTKYLSQ